ncbi:hypothetical protein SAMN05444146_3693 [Flavobacterium johnsoniae]|nr:hypothetical protein SAMN05444146_3693 [Flavobacterium johnsoniae]
MYLFSYMNKNRIIMETSPVVLKVLQILAERYGTSCSLEELTRLVNQIVNTSMSFTDCLYVEKMHQSSVLDALLYLNDQGLIFLNSDTDRSVITIKGLMKVNHKVLCN